MLTGFGRNQTGGVLWLLGAPKPVVRDYNPYGQKPPFASADRRSTKGRGAAVPHVLCERK